MKYGKRERERRDCLRACQREGRTRTLRRSEALAGQAVRAPKFVTGLIEGPAVLRDRDGCFNFQNALGMAQLNYPDNTPHAQGKSGSSCLSQSYENDMCLDAWPQSDQSYVFAHLNG